MSDIGARYSINGTTTLVTGATGDIGQCICKTFKSRGQRVIGIGRSEDKLIALRSMDIETTILEMKNFEQVLEYVDSGLMPAVDNIVFCHGISVARQMRFASPDFIQSIINTNLTSVMVMIAGILKRKKLNRPGRVVFISSIAAHIGSPFVPIYSGAKAGMEGLSRSLARDYLKKGITFNSIAPAAIPTSIYGGEEVAVLDESLYPLGLGSVEDVANAAEYLCLSGNRFTTGETIVLDGGAQVLR